MVIKFVDIKWLLAGIIFLLLPFFTSFRHLIEENHYIMLLGGCFILLCATLSINRSEWIPLSMTDILVLLFGGWILMTTFLWNERRVSDENIVLWIVAGVFYISGRIYGPSSQRIWIYIVIALGGFIQSIYGCLQYIEWLPSNHLYFSVTGSFFNPAHLGAYTGLAIWAFFFLMKAIYGQKRWSLFGGLLLAALPVTMLFIIIQSRASWVALFLSFIGFYYFCKRRKIRFQFFLYSLLVITLLAVPLYNLKKDSADGRLFIWRVSSELINEAPLTGKGADSFPAGYMLAQASYFKENPNSEHTNRATSNIHAFNEPLRICCEYGIIGLLIFLILFVALFTSRSDCYISAMLLYLCVFSCFSYVGEVSSLLIMVAFLLGVTSGSGKKKIKGCACRYRNFLRTGMISFACLMAVWACWRYQRVLSGYVFAKQYNRSYILNNAHYLYKNGQYTEALPFLQRGAELLPSPDLYIDLGNCLMYLERYTEAEKVISTAIYMVPGHILPHYYLFRFYVETGNDEKAKALGEKILISEYKLEGSVAMEVKHYVRKYLGK